MEYNSQTLIEQKRRTLIDKETGEVFEVDQITKRALGQKAFWKLYLLDFLHVLGVFELKQMEVVIHILENTEPATNTYIGTITKIAKRANVSDSTVKRVIKKLIDCKFLNKIHTGVYQISPNVIMKGSEHKKSLLLNYYRESENEKPE